MCKCDCVHWLGGPHVRLLDQWCTSIIIEQCCLFKLNLVDRCISIGVHLSRRGYVELTQRVN